MNLYKVSRHIKWTFFQENSKKFRYLTLFTFIVAFIGEKYIDSHGRPDSLFILVMVAAGLSLFNILQQVIISLLVTITIFYPFHFGFPNPIFLTMQCLSHFFICFIITYLIKVHIQEHKNTVNFVETLAKTIESKDNYTASHSMKVAKYARIIAQELNYTESECETIFEGALLHDIGKIGIKDSILNKPIKLTEEEYKVIQQHPIIGSNMLKLIENFKENKILDMIVYHHERYDGKGYPNKLKGTEIPQCAAIIAVADAFDAMCSKRIYREGHDLAYAINELKINSGSQFDPIVANAFVDYLLTHKHDVIIEGVQNGFSLHQVLNSIKLGA